MTWSPRAKGDAETLHWSWAALHFLFTGTLDEGEAPACYLVRGAYAIGDT